MRKNMNKKIGTIDVITGLVFGVFGLTGCHSPSYSGTASAASNIPAYEECRDGICTSNQEFTAICTENSAGYSECQDNTDVNYTQVAADYRTYGERSPRDHRITQAGAGNNISASIPPSIDDEVTDYEATINGENGSPQNDSNNWGGEVNGINNQHDESVGNAPSAGTSTAVEENQNKDWLAEEGQSLKELLTQWSEESGWRLIWKTNRNYILNAGAMFRGNFADVASALVRAFARARPAPVATFYKGNRVLVIETMEDENAYD